ncbi:MAG: flippase [Candidatus Bathyarchaeota archaeon]|nr:flippase [Candidatus Bathyarchaeota archaeon]
MNTIKRIRKNMLALSLSSLSKLLTLVLLIFCANILPGKEWGMLAAALALTEILSVAADLGLSSLVIREVAREKTQVGKYLSNGIFIKLFLSAIAIALIFLIANLRTTSSVELTVIYILTFRIVLFSFAKFMESIFQAFERMEYSALVTILERVTTFILGWLALYLGLGLIGVSWAIFIGSGFYLLLSSVILINKFARPRFSVNRKEVRSLIKQAFPFALTFIFLVIYFRIDMVMLREMKGALVVGWYAASYQIIQALMVIPAIAMAVLFPLLSRYYKYSQPSLVLAYKKSFQYMLYLALPIAVGTTLLADKIIILLYPGLEGYSNSIVALKILIWALALIFVNTVMANVINSINEVKYSSFVIGINAVINVGLNLIFIPEWGLNLSYRGASITTVICEIVGFVLNYSFICKKLTSLNLPVLFVKPILACGVMGAFIFFFSSHIGLYLTIPLAILFYFLALYFMKPFDSVDMKIWQEVLPRRRANI